MKPFKTNIDWSFKDAKSETLHSIHPYPAKFIPEIPKTLINNLFSDKESYILDPFCGSGVTLVEAQRLGYKSIGVDLNPIACLISRTKVNPLAENFLVICKDIVEKCKSGDISPIYCDFKNREHWFSTEIYNALAELKGGISTYEGTEYFDALNLCFSSIIVRVSNQDSDTRYAFRDKGKNKEDVLKFFFESAKKLKKAKVNSDIPSEVINSNVLTLSDKQIPNNIGLVVTSPPYPCAYEYWLYHKFRMYWLGYDPQEVKEQEIGTRSLYFKKKKYEGYDFANQMEQLLAFLYPKCLDGAYLCFVQGRSKIHGEIYNNDEIIADIGKECGYNHIETIERELDSSHKSFNLSHARIQKEYIVILQK